MDISIDYIDDDQTDKRHDLILNVKLAEKVDGQVLHYYAANPPDYRTSYSGSGLPFANYEQAYENTTNYGSVEVKNNGDATIKMRFPNSYYINLGNYIVHPNVKITYNINNVEKEINVKLSDGLPYRSLTHPFIRNSSNFYGHGWSLPVLSQENILKNSAYPSMNTHYDNFWGMKPPQ